MKKTFRYAIRYMTSDFKYSCPAYVDAEDIHDAICKFNEKHINSEIVQISKLATDIE